MSIISDIAKKRNCKCAICGTTETYYDSINKIYKWYKAQVVGEAGFWCRGCYQYVYSQMKNNNEY